jgi:hypothetical protein
MRSEEFTYSVIPKASFRPNKIVFYNQVIKRASTPSTPRTTITPETKKELLSWGIGRAPIVQTNRHNFEISKKAAANIKEKVTWLYELARNKTITTTGGKTLYSFKMNFITLNLPAQQAHTTDEITKNCLNQFLTECKLKYNLQNYVWRLEFQKNGNAHYHIATDTFIDYTACKLIWNRCLKKLGYIQRYQQKFIGMTFAKYCELYNDNGKTPFNVLRERFGRGCATRWDSPNTVDVRAVSNSKNIAFYISKYITKKSDHVLNKIVSEREPSSTNLRLWFCSRSLSALDKIEIFMEEYDYLVQKCIASIDHARKYIFDYCSVWYFNQKDQISETKRDLWLLYRRYASERNYVPAH